MTDHVAEQFAQIDALMDSLFGSKDAEPDYILYSADGDASRGGCFLYDAVQVATGRNIEDIDYRDVPGSRIAVLRDNDAREWCLWDGENERWQKIADDEYNYFDIKFRGQR